jgi:hypothetical protein
VHWGSVGAKREGKLVGDELREGGRQQQNQGGAPPPNPKQGPASAWACAGGAGGEGQVLAQGRGWWFARRGHHTRPPSSRLAAGMKLGGARRALCAAVPAAPTLYQQRPVWVCVCGCTSVQGSWSWAGVAQRHQRKQKDRGDGGGGEERHLCPLRPDPKDHGTKASKSEGEWGIGAACVCVRAAPPRKITQSTRKEEEEHKTTTHHAQAKKNASFRLVRFSRIRGRALPRPLFARFCKEGGDTHIDANSHQRPHIARHPLDTQP